MTDEITLDAKKVIWLLCLIVGGGIGFYVGILSNDNTYFGCHPRDIEEGRDYIYSRLENLDNITMYEDMPYAVRIEDYINLDASLVDMFGMCDLYKPLCNDIIDYELKRLCYDIK